MTPSGIQISRRAFIASWAAATAMLVSGCSGGNSGASDTVAVVDMGGTEKHIPASISKVFCTNPIGSADVYCLDRDALVGWNFKPSGGEGYIPQEYLDLPSLGVWMGAGNTPNPEEIAQQDPDLLLCFWTADDAGISMVEEIESQTSMTTMLVDYRLDAAPEALRFVGELLGCQDRAEELAAYCEEKIAQIQAVAAQVTERKSIYLAQSTGGLSTDPVGSMHVDDALELCGVDNVADLPGTVGQGMGMPTVNLEQIIQWNPDAVLVSEYSMTDSQMSDLYGEICADSGWQQVPAVRNGDVYRIPQAPFSWFGRPPSVARLLGCMMLQKLLYPQLTDDLDLEQEAADFYQLFYGCDIKDGLLDFQ